MNAPYYPGRYNLIENFAENFTTAKEKMKNLYSNCNIVVMVN